jgi:apolipoprotein N-acyltransferase
VSDQKPLALPFPSRRRSRTLLLPLLAGAAYWIAFSIPAAAPAVLLALLSLCLLAQVTGSRQAFCLGLAAGFLMYVPHLWFFEQMLGGPLAIALWTVAALPIAMFVLLVSLTHRRLGSAWALWLTPVIWTGLEYFRSELYYLRFAWLLPGQTVAFLPGVRLAWIGVYGLGFIFALAAALTIARPLRLRAAGAIVMIVLMILMYWPPLPATPSDAPLHVAGVQLESVGDRTLAAALDHLARAHPEAQVLVLSEYTFAGTVPNFVRSIIKRHHRYLIAGGIKGPAGWDFYDTAYVIGPDGRDVFEQGKSVPVQLCNDGLLARQRRVWDSPWGKIGIAVCYDLSYSRVMDDFIRQGAQALIIPTMDVTSWGEHERRMLHGRLAPIRSAEYAIPSFGVWSSGVSQLTDRFGRVLATAGYPGQGDTIAGPLLLGRPGRVPPDRWPAMAATSATGLLIALFAVQWLWQKPWSRRPALKAG